MGLISIDGEKISKLIQNSQKFIVMRKEKGWKNAN